MIQTDAVNAQAGFLQSRAVAVAAWTASRLLMVSWCGGAAYKAQEAARGDVRLYHTWVYTDLAHGHFPHSAYWQYPPGAAGILEVPRLLTGFSSYLLSFIVVMLLADLAIFTMLVRRERGRVLLGAWVWIAGMLALGPIPLLRFDLVPTAFAVAGLVVVARPWLSGMLLGLGGMTKVWPAALVVAVPRPGRLRAVGGIATAAIAVVLPVATFGPSGWSDFLSNQRHRGLQIESVAATPYSLLHSLGAVGHARYAHGAWEWVGSGTSAVAGAAKVASLAVLVVIAAAALLRGRGGGPEASPAAVALPIVLLLMITAPVLSPQYFVWAFGVAALKVVDAERLDRSVRLLLVAAVLTQLVYPLIYRSLLEGAVLPTVALVLRNIAVVAAATFALLETRRHQSEELVQYRY